MQYSEVTKDLLNYYERRQRSEVVPVTSELSKLVVNYREVTKDEEFACGVCNNEDYEDDDLIVICS